MIYIIAIQALALAVCLWYIGKLWFSREFARELEREAKEISEGVAGQLAKEREAYHLAASLVETLSASETRLRALLHEAAGLLMDERHRSKPRTGDSRKTDNYGDWATKRDELVKRIGGEESLEERRKELAERESRLLSDKDRLACFCAQLPREVTP